MTTFAERYHDKIVSQGEHQLWTGAMKADGVGVLKWNESLSLRRARRGRWRMDRSYPRLVCRDVRMSRRV